MHVDFKEFSGDRKNFVGNVDGLAESGRMFSCSVDSDG